MRDGWKSCVLGELVEQGLASLQTGPFGTQLKTSEYVSDGIPLVSVREIQYGEIVVVAETPRLSEETIKRLPRFVLREGDIVFGRKGSIDRSARVKSSQDGWFLGSDGIRLRLADELDSHYIAYQIRSANVKAFLLKNGEGSTMPSLNQGVISRIPLSLPPLPTQRRIAAVLGALDDKIELNRKMNANLEAQAQALFGELKRKGEMPFLSVIDLLSGGTPRTDHADYWGGNIPFFSPKDVDAPFVVATERYVTDKGVENCNSALYPAYTTLITARGTVGKICLAGVPMAMNQSCFALASKIIHPLLVYFYARESVRSLKAKSNGAVFDAITISEFKTEIVNRADVTSEKQFVQKVMPLFELMLNNINESRKLAELRDALLPKLMSGELEVA